MQKDDRPFSVRDHLQKIEKMPETALLEVYKHARFLYVFANRLAFST